VSRASFGKREREQAKREKAANKRERRQRAADEASATDVDGEAAAAPADDGVSTADLLQMIEDVHRRHENGDMTDDDFETTKADLLGRIQVD